MPILRLILNLIGSLTAGIIGALVFVVFLLPYLLASPAFENYQFVKDFKQGKIVINQTDKIYIQENLALEQAIERVKGSVVMVLANRLTSGLIATSDGSVITLASTIGSSSSADIFWKGEKQTAKVVKIDWKNNLALLKIDKNNLQTVGLANSDSIKLGQKVFLVAPMEKTGNQWFANEGIISRLDADILMTNIASMPVLAGGPLFNMAGELVGLNFIGSDGKISAVSVDKIQSLLGL